MEHMVWIPPGQFWMGSPPDEPGHSDNETLHEVSLSQGFYIGQFEVTQAEYKAVTGMNPSYWKSGTHPVEQVTYQDALNYCTILSLKERNAGRLPVDWEYRLPTEAEWEYACRAESTGRFGSGIPEDLTTADANIGNTDGKTVAAGSYSPNAWGLYDMHGNVWEWVLDNVGYYEQYEQEAVTDPTGPETGNGRRLRGGSWRYGKEFARSAYRNGDEPSRTYNDYGFRVVLARSAPPATSPEQAPGH
jgi:formylglycine-generating enzyme required for sulfatase activity